MKRFSKIIFAVLAIGAVLVITCPNKEAHKDAMLGVINTVMEEELQNSLQQSEFAALGSLIGSKVVEVVVDQKLVVKNYFVCSIGEVTYDGETHIVSLGIMNHIFTFDEEELRNAMK